MSKVVKRRKNYNPNAHRQRIANIIAQKVEAKRCLKIAPRYFEMSWNSDEVERRKAEWRKLNKGYISAGEMIECFDNQDLAIATTLDLIKQPLSWEVGIQITFFNPKTEEVEVRQKYVDLPSMDYFDIFNPKENIKVDLGHGLKVRWQGIGKAVDVKGLTNDFVVHTTDLWVRALAEFKDMDSQTNFHICEMERERINGCLRKYVDFRK